MHPYPEIRDLQLLIALSQRKHFTQAAADCGISQPAFSARIRHLEEQLGVPIVRRGNKFLGFTPDGDLVLRWANRILADAEGLRQDIAVSKGALRGNLVLGVVPTALVFASSVSTQLRNSYPDLVIQIKSLTSMQITRSLLDFSVDAGITYAEEQSPPTLVFDKLYDEHYVLLAPAALAPRQQGHASWAEAAALPLCLLSRDMHFRQIVDGAFAQADVSATPVMETNALTAVLSQVADGSAATIAPANLVAGLLLGQDTVSLELDNPVIANAIGLAVTDHEPSLTAIDALRRALSSHHS